MLNSLVAATIRSTRMSVGMTQTELAERMGYEAPTSISALELDRAEITMDIFEKFCQVFGLEPTEVLRSLQAIHDAEERMKSLTDQLHETRRVADMEENTFMENVLKKWEEKNGR